MSRPLETPLPSRRRCAACGLVLRRRPGEGASDYRSRKTCGRACGHTRRGLLARVAPKWKRCRCGAWFGQEDEEPYKSWRQRRACSRKCRHVPRSPLPLCACGARKSKKSSKACMRCWKLEGAKRKSANRQRSIRCAVCGSGFQTERAPSYRPATCGRRCTGLLMAKAHGRTFWVSGIEMSIKEACYITGSERHAISARVRLGLNPLARRRPGRSGSGLGNKRLVRAAKRIKEKPR
jgi:hypothetical protein